MSVFFIGERRVPPEPEPTPDWDAALQAVSNRLILNQIAGAGNISPGKAEHLRGECRRIDPLVTRWIVDNPAAPQADIVQFIRDNTEGFFPAVKFVEVMKVNAGGTLALLRTACADDVS